MPASVVEPVVEADELVFPSELEPGHGNNGGGPGDFDPGDNGGGGGGDGDGDDGETFPPAGIYRISLWATLSAVFALFAVLALAYVARSQNPKYWDPISLPRLLWFSTGLLLLSSLTCEAGRSAMGQRRERAYAGWLLVTALLGIGFLTLQIAAWKQLAEQGIFLTENPHSSFFYLFTAAHGLHLIGGILFLLVLALRAFIVKRQHRWTIRLELAGVATVYWHFMGALWCGLFLLLLVRG